jgi:hypothetical protein
LILISSTGTFPPIVRLLGFVSALLFATTALRIFGGAEILPTTSPLPFFAYPVFVATFVGWIWTLLRVQDDSEPGRAPTGPPEGIP